MAAVFHNSTSPLSVESVSRLLPSGKLQRFLDPMFAQMVEIRGQLDGNGLLAPPRDVVEQDVRAHLVHDAALGKSRVFQVEVPVFRVLLQVFPVLVHGPEVHDAVAVGEKVDAPVPPHGVFAGARVVPGERNGFRAAGGILPEVLDLAALVALRVAALERQAGEI
ncbi:MAG: hypothetical protein LAQ30_27695 [Acidobacteriia bacterium]|nr:hypothetical protein [Terriglobia bacterium]